MKKINRTRSEKVIILVASILFMIYAILLIFPFAWCFFNSFKSRSDFIFNTWGLPEKFVWQNYIDCFYMTYNDVAIIGMFKNSIIFTVGCTIISLFFCSATSYTITKYHFFGRNFFYTFTFIMMLVPAMGATAANYKLYNELHIYDTYIGIFIGSMGGFGGAFLFLYGFYKNLSWSYAEAAFIDGAGHFITYFKIMLPMAMPAIIAIGIMNAIGVWNDYFTFYLYAPSKVTIAVGINGLSELNKAGKISFPQLFAAMIISMIPVVVIYSIAQKFIVENTTIGGVKG